MAITVGTNSYVSVADTDTYFTLNNLGATWPTATTGDKEKALVTATAMIDNNYQFIGVSVSASQALAWPRDGAEYMDPRTGRLTATNDTVMGAGAGSTVPARVVRATQELAELVLVNGGDLSESEQTFERIKIGPIELEDSSASANKESLISPLISNLLAPLINPRSSSRAWWRAN